MKDIIKDAEEHIINLLQKKLSTSHLYHNYVHAARVVDAVKELGKHHEISKDEQFILIIAAWFHDAGYIDGHENHEERSGTFARTFLEDNKIDEKTIKEVEKCILATKKDSVPETLLERIIADADNIHLSKKYFEKATELLRQEYKLTGRQDATVEEWLTKNIEFLSQEHQYHTTYAIKNWKASKQKNLSKLLQQQKKFSKKRKEAKQKVRFKNESPERGIQTLFRVSLRNHIKLSDIADTKANILLSVNAIIISLALANLIPKLDSPSNTHLMIPSLILVLFSVASIILSIMSTSPKVDKGEFTKDDVYKRNVNLLFFGNFHKMKYEDYEWAIDQILDDKDYVYHSLTKDLYLLGRVLKKKYSLLKITYTVFMIGIIISVIAFIIAFGTI